MGSGVLTGNYKKDIVKVDKQTKLSASTNGLLQDAKSIDINNPKADINKPHLVNSSSINKPSGLSWGIREVNFYDNSKFTIDILGVNTNGEYLHWVSIGIKTDTMVTFSDWSVTSNINTKTVGSNTKPVYFKDGKAIEIGYSLNSDVPSDAKFTDTVYTHPSTSGNKHIPMNGMIGQILGFDSNGTAKWINTEQNISSIVVSDDGNNIRYNYEDGSYEVVDISNENSYRIGTYNKNGVKVSTVNIALNNGTITIN